MIHARSDYDRIQDPEGIIPEDEPVFLLRAKDDLFIPTVAHWLTLLELYNGDPTSINCIRGFIDKAIEWREKNNHLTKLPDMPRDAAKF